MRGLGAGARRIAKRGLAVAGVVVLGLGAIVVVRAVLAGGTRPPPPPPLPESRVDPELAAKDLARLLTFKTISHEDPREDDPAALDGMRAAIEVLYPHVHATLRREIVGDHGLVYTWPGSDPSLEPVLLTAHQDVVPIEPGTEARWEHPPFDGVVADGYVWGRGAIDDKGSLVAILEAAEDLAAHGFKPKRTVVLAFGADEEVGGERGAVAIAAAFAARGQRFDFALDEGGAVTVGLVPGVAAPVAVVGVGEKGFATVDLTVHMPTGHSSMPPPQTSIGVVAAAIDRLERVPMPAHMTWVTRAMLGAMAPEMPLSARLAVANLWLFEPVVLRLLGAGAATNASIRTTTAPTLFQAGVKDNVLPSEARASVNFRILPGDSVDGVLAHVRAAVDDPRVEVTLHGSHPATEPVTPSATDSRGFRLIGTAVRQVIPGAVVAPSITVGATDVRHYAGVCGGTYRFVPFTFTEAAMATLHGTNERLAVEQLGPAIRFYEQVMRGE